MKPVESCFWISWSQFRSPEQNKSSVWLRGTLIRSGFFSLSGSLTNDLDPSSWNYTDACWDITVKYIPTLQQQWPTQTWQCVCQTPTWPQRACWERNQSNSSAARRLQMMKLMLRMMMVNPAVPRPAGTVKEPLSIRAMSNDEAAEATEFTVNAALLSQLLASPDPSANWVSLHFANDVRGDREGTAEEERHQDRFYPSTSEADAAFRSHGNNHCCVSATQRNKLWRGT